MTSGPRVRNTIPKVMMTTEPPQLKSGSPAKLMAPIPGYVDGAWWPRTRDLSAELPALLAVLAARLGPIAGLSYHSAAWDPGARRFGSAGSLVPRGGYRRQNQDTVEVRTLSGDRVTLAVVSSDGEPAPESRLRIHA
ncbi:DUF5994 family protein [Amycolatopsis thermophila]|uniref:Uncharacterized protein n=1 Tax=Amycolatopsis thermophila TaxID=206084 RepID=A0ABU0F6E0_9PSEU|nr:DUF5994 family protein [Amycolatopsis thermophila]MDQ0383163.1 hypothetical protein [Amycolatopsis thermophila]